MPLFDKLLQCHSKYQHLCPRSHIDDGRVGVCGGCWQWCLMLPELLLRYLSLVNPGVVILEYARTFMKSIDRISWSLSKSESSSRPDQQHHPQITGSYSTHHSGTGYIIKTHGLPPSLQRPIFLLPRTLKPFFPWLTTQLSSPNHFSFLPLASLRVEMLLLPLLNIAPRSTVVFLWFDFTKRLNPYQPGLFYDCLSSPPVLPLLI